MRGHDQHQADVARLHDFGVAVEDGEQGLSPEEDGPDGQAQDKDALSQAEGQGFPAAFYLPGSEVLPHEGGAGLAEGVEDIVSEDFNIVGCAGGCHHDGSQAVDGGLDYDVGGGKHSALDSGRQADLKDPFQNREIDFQPVRLHTDFQGRGPQPAVQDQGADCVGDDGGDGDPVYRHVQDDHEKQVQDHVQAAGRRPRRQGDFGFAHASEDGRLEVVKEDDGHP